MAELRSPSPITIAAPEGTATLDVAFALLRYLSEAHGAVVESVDVTDAAQPAFTIRIPVDR